MNLSNQLLTADKYMLGRGGESQMKFRAQDHLKVVQVEMGLKPQSQDSWYRIEEIRDARGFHVAIVGNGMARTL